MSYLQRVPQLIEAIKRPYGSPGRDAAIEEIAWMAMKADTLDLLDERGRIPETLSYRERRVDTRHPQQDTEEGDAL